MSDYTVYGSEQELRENLNDLDDLLADYDKSQRVLDEQRGVLADRVQGALAIYEKQVSDYEQKRDDLNRRQKELSQSRAEAVENRERLQQQVDAKQDAKLGKKTDDGAGLKASGQGQGTGQADGTSQTTGPTTREQIDSLKEQLSKPKPTLNLDPPGMADSQATTIDRDLKLMAKIKEKEQKMDGASQKLKDDWNRSKGPKR